MIEITVVKDNTDYKRITVKGHSGYSEYGTDIVCAGISSVTISIINGLTEIAKISGLTTRSSDGFIELLIDNIQTTKDREILNLFLDTLILSYTQIYEDYPEEITIFFKGE